jgi:hypothetical protein
VNAVVVRLPRRGRSGFNFFLQKGKSKAKSIFASPFILDIRGDDIQRLACQTDGLPYFLTLE